MATEEGLSNAIGCMATVFPEFLATEIARLTDEIVSATQAVTDPLAAIADQNVDGLVDDAATLASGSIVESLAVTATGLAGSYVRRGIQDRVDAAALAFPAATKKVLQSGNVGEQVLSNAMLLFSLFNEAPYAIAQRMCQKIIDLGDLKIEQLECLKKHIVQMNNVVAALAFAKNEIVNFPAELASLSQDLESAKRDLRVAVFTQADGSFGFDELALERAVQSLRNAEARLNPQNDDLSLLDLTNILTTGSISPGNVTEANIKLAALVLPHLNFLLEAEMAAVTSVTDAINFQIAGIVGVVSSFQSAATSSRTGAIRARTIEELCNKVQAIQLEVDAARATTSTKTQTRLSLLWDSQLQSIIVTAEKIQNTAFEAGSSEGPARAQELQAAYDALIADFNNINSDNVTSGVDDVFSLSVLVTNIRKSGDRLLDLLDERPLTDAELTNFSVLVAQAATGGSNRIDESISAVQGLQQACETFLAENIGFVEDYERLITLFDSVGFDRGRDLLDAGRMDEFFDAGLDQLSYVNTAVSCLTDAINGVDDIGTQNEIAALRDELQSQRSNELLTGADNFNFGGTKILDTARAELERFQQKQEAARSLVEKLTALAMDLGFTVSQLGQGFEQLKGNLERLNVDANGRLSADLDDFIRRPGAGVPICL